MSFKKIIAEITWMVALSAALHALLIAYGQHQDATSSVKYTDVDYDVFSDAARSLAQGGSPFDRATYRYTPLLAWILYLGAGLGGHVWGKVIFSVFDVAVGCLIYKIVSFQESSSSGRIAAAVWLLNPVVLVVSTRGNAESLVAFLVVASMYCTLKRWPILGGLAFGLSVHFKIYPIIYAAPLYFSFGQRNQLFWPNAARFRFTLVSAVAFLLPTFVFYWIYGQKYVDEAFLYHLRRSDVKHNFSPYFYLMYLMAGHHNVARWLSLAAFLPQALVVVAVALKYSGPRHLPFCMFLQTFAFVALNKVCTSQYFIWYLCLLPTVLTRLAPNCPSKILAVVGAWVSSQAAWLFAAYLLEFRGLDTFVYVWLASLCFLLSNVYAMDFFINSYAM